MDSGIHVYSLILLHLFGVDYTILNNGRLITYDENADELSFKGRMKKNAFLLLNCIQCDTIQRVLIIGICINIAYERWLNY
tara:strand:+ start:22 stop:264 length:243 start_codon:yes stop_codon:yes gene_type:complete